MGMTLDRLMAMLEIESASLVALSDEFAVIRRDPQPNEDGIDTHAAILFTVVDLNWPGDPTAANRNITFTLNVKGVLAATYNGILTVEPGWNAFTSAVTWGASTFYQGFDVNIDQGATALFTSEQHVDVELTLHCDETWVAVPWGSGVWHTPVAPYDWVTSWAFDIEDLTPPKLLTATPRAPLTLRVVFDDGMTVGVGVDCADDPTNWTITRHNVDPDPAVELTVESVVAVDGTSNSEFDITFNWEQTPACEYHAHVSALVEDDAGNLMDSAFVVATFYGFQPDVPPGRVFDLWRFLPRKIRTRDDSKDLKRLINCWQELVNLMIREIDRMPDTFDPDLCDDATIDAMLYDLGNPFSWTDLELTLQQKRKLVRYLVPIYKLKGTATGIEAVVLFLLGKIVHVVDFLAVGWKLGVDALGDGGIAIVKSELSFPANLTVPPIGGLPFDIEIQVDDGTTQVIPITPATDFVDPADAQAQEMVDAINGHLVGATAMVIDDGTPAVITTGAGPFAIVAGDNLLLTVDGGEEQEVVMQAGDFVSAGSVTVDEVAHRFAASLEGLRVELIDGFTVARYMRLVSKLVGAASAVTITGGTLVAKLGLASATGTDGENVAIYSNNPEVGARVEVLLTSVVAEYLGFIGVNSAAEIGGCVLAVDDERGLYSFDIQYDTVLTSDEMTIVRRIAEYMKPAHTHLVNIRAAKTLPWPDGWTLGWSHLDDESELMEG